VEALALELARVRANAVTPELMDTPLLHTADGWERSTIGEKRACMLSGKRVGTADEVVQVIFMMVTNDYLTGEVMYVNGGGCFVSQCSIDSVHD
jgi:NAD(P)-dependent dehydrogenase (short-subunit alcohol dehydrogenase family)